MAQIYALLPILFTISTFTWCSERERTKHATDRREQSCCVRARAVVRQLAHWWHHDKQLQAACAQAESFFVADPLLTHDERTACLAHFRNKYQEARPRCGHAYAVELAAHYTSTAAFTIKMQRILAEDRKEMEALRQDMRQQIRDAAQEVARTHVSNIGE